MNLVRRIAGAARLLATGKLAQSAGFDGAQMQRRLMAWRGSSVSINSLILQGVDEGMSASTGVFGWSLVIDQSTGKAVLSATGSGIAYVAFGTCMPASAAGQTVD